MQRGWYICGKRWTLIKFNHKMETKLQNCFCRQASSCCCWMFRNVLPKNEHFIIVYSCPVSFRPPYFLSSTNQKKAGFSSFFIYKKSGWWFMLTIPNRPGKYHKKTVSFVIVSYSLFFQSDILVLLLNAIMLSFKGQHNWLSELNTFYFIFWSLYGMAYYNPHTDNYKSEIWKVSLFIY